MHVWRVLVLLLLLCGFQSIKTYGQVVATWTDSSGNWSNPANWSTHSVPKDAGGTFYNAVINGTGSDTITFDSSGTIINGLSLGPGETFQDNGHSPTLTIGELAFPAAGSFTNSGTINWANGSNLTIASSGANNGTINVTGGAGLTLNGQFENFGTLDINHSSLTGSYNTNISGDAGPLVIENGSTATLAVMNIFENSFGSVGTVVSNGSTLSVGFLHNFALELDDLGGSVVTIGGIDNTNGFLFVDHSTMNFLVDYSGGDPTGGSIVVQNGGTLNVNGGYDSSFGGAASITGKSVANIVGTLSNNSGIGSFTVDNSVLNVGGDMVNDSSSAILQNHSIGVIGGSLNNGFGSNMTIDQSFLTVRGNVDNAGTANLTIENAATLNVLGNFSNLSGEAPATMTLNGGSIVNVAGTLTNNQGAVLMMSGTNDVLNAQGLFTNAGSVTVGSLETLNANGGFANSGGNVSISSGGALSTSNYSQSSGLTDVSGNLTSHSYSQAGGNTTVETGGVLSTTTFTATGGTVTVNGTLDPTAVEIGSRGALQGTGTIIGNVAMGGTIMPGAPGTPGTITIFGNYEQIGNGTLEELMSPLSRSFLDVKGSVALDANSRLDIILVNGYDPLGQKFSLMGYNSLVGQFSNGSSFWEDGFLWDITYGQHGVDVTAVGVSEPSSLLQLSIGLAALAFYAHRKMGKTRRLA